MGNKEELIRLLKDVKSRDMTRSYLRLLIMSILAILNPFIIASKLQTGDSLLVIFLILSEILLIGFLYGIWISLRDTIQQQKNISYVKFLDHPETINKIIISNDKIVFDIIGEEDEVFIVGNSKRKTELYELLSKIFGIDKIALKP